MRDSHGDEWLTITEAAEKVRRSRRTIERWLDAGLPSQRVRGTRYIREADLFARLRLILVTEPEVKKRHEARTGTTAALLSMPPRSGVWLLVISAEGATAREGEVYDWNEAEMVEPGRYARRVWFVGDREPTTFSPADYREMIVTRLEPRL